MCRHLAYVGPSVPVARVLLDPAHSLERQAWDARELLQGTVAADGFGVAWYDERAGRTPAVYRSVRPIWADRGIHGLATHVHGHAMVANVRNATEVGTTEEANVHPFTHDVWSFSHNGFLADFRSRTMRALRGGLSEGHYAALRGASDAETIFRLILTRIDEGQRPRDALAGLARDLLARADDEGFEAQLNFLLSDGAVVYATRAGGHGKSNSLYVAHDAAAWPGATLVASEPLDKDPAWTPVPHQHLVVLHAGEPADSHAL